MKTRTKVGLGVVAALALTGLWVVTQAEYAYEERPVVIEAPEGRLSGVLALPRHRAAPVGLVLFVHGDGAIDATHDDGYKALWESLAAVGYASLSLDKRGVGHSEGSWLDQSLDDRVVEAQRALAWARGQPEIDKARMGVWGASQAGWVIPKLAARERLAFAILVAPAIQWLRQGEYNTRQEGGSLVTWDQDVKLLEQKATYARYRAETLDPHPMAPARWSFVMRNYRADAEPDLKNFATPVLLLLGDQDTNVDYQETEAIYRKNVPSPLLTVKVFAGADHSLVPGHLARWPLVSAVWFLLSPRDATVAGYRPCVAEFVSRIRP